MCGGYEDNYDDEVPAWARTYPFTNGAHLEVEYDEDDAPKLSLGNPAGNEGGYFTPAYIRELAATLLVLANAIEETE
jgi:hypothetical protein